MKISCPSCSAKYSIADEKVQDRLAKIRCRKCGTTIVIDGKQDPPSVQAADASAKEEPEPQNDPPAEAVPPGAYTVDVADDDQRTMTVEEIVNAYNAGVVNADTYVWKDGMGDWEPLADVTEINAALHAAAGDSGGGDDDPTQTFNSSDLASGLAASAASSSAEEPPAPALRSGTGRGSAADLFGSIDMAGGEQNITTSAAGSAVAATGARNESSVLFSLSALTSAPADDDAKSGVTEDSGLIDLAALTAGSASDDGQPPVPSLDFGAAPLGAAPLGLAPAPLGGAPSPGFSVDARPAQPTGGNHTKFIASLAAIVVIALGGLYLFKDNTQPVAAPAATVVIPAPAPEVPAPANDEAVAAANTAAAKDPSDTNTEEAAEAKNDAVAAAAPTPPKSGNTARKKPVTKRSPPPRTKKKAATPTSSKKKKKSTTKKKKKKSSCNCKPSDLMCAMKCSAK